MMRINPKRRPQTLLIYFLPALSIFTTLRLFSSTLRTRRVKVLKSSRSSLIQTVTHFGSSTTTSTREKVKSYISPTISAMVSSKDSTISASTVSQDTWCLVMSQVSKLKVFGCGAVLAFLRKQLTTHNSSTTKRESST